ncbi:MAG TPA: hypothetical protein VLU43_13960 [Anaeromyxobacteraceae bacterium]|nr:hypothetical protein [Anaeromyxobacteraceae bacterium]
MIVCPVCEHAQAQGAECEVCGKKLLHGAAAIPEVVPVDGLEPTRLAASGDAAPELVPDLEPTLAAGVEVDVVPTPDVEPTRAAPVDVGDPGAIPDIERTSAEIPGDQPTPQPVIAVCRYCRTPAMPGERLCGRCGMRLPVLDAPPAAAGAALARCSSCGAPVTGSRCPACGGRIATGS